MESENPEAQSHNYLRLALPLMSEHRIPVTPKNYTVWYTYVSNENNELSKAINSIIKEKKAFTDEVNESLYNRFFMEKDENELKKLKDDIQEVLVTILKEIMELSGQTEKYESMVSKSVNRLTIDSSADQIKDIVNGIIQETKSIGNFGKSIRQKLKETTENLEAIQKEFEQVKEEARVDFLTGAPNRKAFDDKITELANEAVRGKSELTLLLIDIDHFKKFNDKYGHITGDEVLKFVAKKIRENIKGGDFFARFGGEEFVVLLPNTSLAGAQGAAENIRSFFAKSELKAVATSEKLGKITVSIGAGCYCPGEPFEKLINRADQALYFAKNNGRNRVATELDI